MNASGRPQKKFSQVVFCEKYDFMSVMVTSPFFGVLHFAFLKLPRAKGKMDIFVGQKNVQKTGGK